MTESTIPISVSILSTGKLVLGPHLPALWRLLSAVSTHCRPLSPARQESRLRAVGMN